MLVPTLLSYKAIIEYTASYNLANKAGMANKASKADKAGILTRLAKLRKFTKRTMLWNTYQYNQFRNYFNIYESLTTRTTTKSFLWPLLVQSINKKTYGKNEMLKNKADVFFCYSLYVARGLKEAGLELFRILNIYRIVLLHFWVPELWYLIWRWRLQINFLLTFRN